MDSEKQALPLLRNKIWNEKVVHRASVPRRHGQEALTPWVICMQKQRGSPQKQMEMIQGHEVQWPCGVDTLVGRNTLRGGPPGAVITQSEVAGEGRFCLAGREHWASGTREAKQGARPHEGVTHSRPHLRLAGHRGKHGGG